GRLGLLGQRLGFERPHALAVLEARQRLVDTLILLARLALALGELAVYAAPAGYDQDLAAGAEDVVGDRRLHARVLEDGVGVEDRQEAAGDDVVDLAVVT